MQWALQHRAGGWSRLVSPPVIWEAALIDSLEERSACCPSKCWTGTFHLAPSETKSASLWNNHTRKNLAFHVKDQKKKKKLQLSFQMTLQTSIGILLVLPPTCLSVGLHLCDLVRKPGLKFDQVSQQLTSFSKAGLDKTIQGANRSSQPWRSKLVASSQGDLLFRLKRNDLNY